MKDVIIGHDILQILYPCIALFTFVYVKDSFNALCATVKKTFNSMHTSISEIEETLELLKALIEY